MMAESRQPLPPAGTRYVWVLRLSAGAMGLLFLTASLIKAMDMGLFIGQIRAYGIVSNPVFIIIIAWGLIALQCALGAGLILFYRPGSLLPLTALLWLFLLLVTGWAWLTGVTQECGCYGAWVRQKPGTATLENLAFFIITLLIWKYRGAFQVRAGGAKGAILAAAVAVGLALPLLSGLPDVSQSQDKVDAFPFALISDTHIPETGRIDFTQGTHLLFLMSTDCLHCREALPEVELLAESGKLPRVIALSMNGDAERERFIREYGPAYPIAQIREDLFWRLLGMADLPRFFLLRDGHVLKVWNGRAPTVEEIEQALASPGPP